MKFSIRTKKTVNGWSATATCDGKRVSAEGSSISRAISALLKLVGLITVFTAIALCFNSCATEHTVQSVCQFSDGTSSNTITYPYKGIVKSDTLVTSGEGWVMKTWILTINR